uniref:B30.2/SPRY domain-containing protein n=1 Tax=Sinocyclocheilus rhinocerous TaxID=307959 RepID=A0A673GN12_9TELE
MEEKQRAAETQEETLIQELQQELSELKMRNTELEHLLHTEDHLHLLQVSVSLSHITGQHSHSSSFILPNALKKLKSLYCEDPERFDHSFCVLGKEGYSSGRFYFEVQVNRKTGWILGVIRESINRKGQMSPQGGYCVVALWNENEYWTLKPQKVGVLVDYEEGLVSFYDVESRSHIYSFDGQSFTVKLYFLIFSYFILKFILCPQDGDNMLNMEASTATKAVLQKHGTPNNS